jgi:flagellar hook assembly protein FlgD
MEREFSAIDAIYQILEKINDLEKKIQVIDDNIKILNNKITKLNKNVSQEPARAMPTASASGQPVVSSFESDNTPVAREPDKLLLGPIKIYGFIMNKMKQPVENVVINIFDNNNKLVKTNKSNTDGYWESRLPSGRYNIEYIHNKFKPVNKEIEIPKNVKEYEVK